MAMLIRVGSAVSRLRAIAALWFASAAFVASALLYLTPAVHGGSSTLALYLACPTISGLVAGWLLGHRVAAAPTPLRAAWLGVGVVALAYVVYALLFALNSAWRGGGQDRPVPLALSVLTIGMLMTGPLTLPIGAVAALIFLRISRAGFMQPHALDS
jgi:hypothetical protein